MNKNEKKTIIRWEYIIVILLVLLDQATKLYFKGFNFLGIEHKGLNYGEQVPVIGTFLQWTYIENAGMAFGIEFGWGKIFLSFFSVIASIFLIILIKKLEGYSLGVRLGFSLILSGAMGNLIDRVFYGVIFGESPLFYGRVVDFIQVDIPDIHFLGWEYFPIFNVADSCVTIGVAFLIIFYNKLPDFKDLFTKKELIKEEINN